MIKCARWVREFDWTGFSLRNCDNLVRGLSGTVTSVSLHATVLGNGNNSVVGFIATVCSVGYFDSSLIVGLNSTVSCGMFMTARGIHLTVVDFDNLFGGIKKKLRFVVGFNLTVRYEIDLTGIYFDLGIILTEIYFDLDLFGLGSLI